VTARGLLRRHLEFRLLALVDVASYAVGYVAVGITAASLGAGVWSLVAAALMQAAISSAGSYALARHDLRPVFRWREIGELYGFGGRVSVISLLEFFGISLDSLFVGRYAGAALLGQYNRGQLLANLPLEHLSHGMTRVLFPAFSSIQHQIGRLRRAYLSAIRLMTFIILPTAAGMAAAADTLVRVVLGPGWEAAAGVLPYLLLVAAVNLTAMLPAIVSEATAALNKKLLIQSAHVAVLGLLLLNAVGGTLESYAQAVALAAGMRLVAYVVAMRWVLRLSVQAHAKTLGPAFVTALLVALSVAATTRIVAAAFPAAMMLVLQVSTGAVVLLVVTFTRIGRSVREDIYDRLVIVTSDTRGRWVSLLLRVLSPRSLG
jgi:lipopolysaccharide exporter